MHLIIDGYVDDRGILKDEKFLRGWLEGYPSRIGMKRISPPFVFEYGKHNVDDWGISGFVFIAESHISFHTFVEQGYVNIDVFSCKDFDTDKAIEEFRAEFGAVRVRTCVIDRDWQAEREPVVSAAPPFAYHGE